ncbi:Transcription factor Tfb4 [Penicillium argentinense]|uniref:General transcription and DNA repair factor IIH subunit TFB4 n=1 Tax=Penicillium argentinense TaxID=1131581 RepID=A0A9W9K9X3_9EURO|nr:Transcription factor Tfb4 [Penicillium argentinense]KAJ5098383.1 Transcription factor Tfb4 [Penicillium argentinense]
MNSVDASEHVEQGAVGKLDIRSLHTPLRSRMISYHADLAPSLLTVILDTNPRAWAALKDSLALSQAVANILVFINAHLAFNYANEVAVVASHSQKAAWLYRHDISAKPSTDNDGNGDIDIDMDAPTPAQTNKYRPFRLVEEQVLKNLNDLMDSTNSDDIRENTSTMLAGALTLALSYTNRRRIAWAQEHGGADLNDAVGEGSGGTGIGSGLGRSSASDDDDRLQSRILIVSVSGSSDSAHQYIPVMNCIFACQRLQIPIDVCKLSGDAVFLQQACDATKGVYMALDEPKGLLQYLMMGFLPDQRSRRHLVLPTSDDVDFRAVCFCHRRVVDIGYVCSICLSIFCEPPPGYECLTCGTVLDPAGDDKKPALIPRGKKKKKKRANATSATGTPDAMSTPTPTPGP